jgi:TolA-binding protein
MTAGRKTAATILPFRRRSEMKPVPLRAPLAAALAAIAILLLAGCAPQDDQALESQNADLRAMLANNQQQMASMQQQMAELNDKLTEMQHNNGSADDQAALKAQIAALQKQVQDANPNPSASPVPPGVVPNGAPGSVNSGFPAGVSPPPAPDDNTVAGNPPPPEPPGPPPAMASPAASPGADSGDDNDKGNSDDDDDNQTASAGAPAAPSMPAPTAVSSWQSQIDPQLTAASSSSDPASKSYSAGLIALKGGMYPQALGKFQELQRRYPK